MSAQVARRWVAPADTDVAAVLRALGVIDEEARRAIGEGRVFVGRRRAKGLDEPVRAREELLLHPGRPRAALPEPFVLLAPTAKRAIVAVHKPAGIPTIPDAQGGENALIAEVARALGVAEATLHPSSRLDREVSGVVIFSLDAAAGALLREARAEGRYARRYLAIGRSDPARGALDDHGAWRWAIGRARDPRLRRAVPSPTPRDEALEAETRFRVVRRRDAAVLLAIAPITGRTHQIRVHAAFAGAPLYGDRAYGGEGRLVSARGSVRTLDRVALHCARVRVDLGAGGVLDVEAPPPPFFADLVATLDLDPAPGEALAEAVSCEL